MAVGPSKSGLRRIFFGQAGTLGSLMVNDPDIADVGFELMSASSIVSGGC